MTFSINDFCSKYFKYKDLILCGKTCLSLKLDNMPENPATWAAIENLACEILDPVYQQFGEIELTYGFCSHKLGRAILKKPSPGIAPNLDQHAGYECNSKGKPICSRGGMACDFIVPGAGMNQVALWVIEHCPFDRLYYYGAQSPLHVSISDKPTREVCVIKTRSVGGRQPYRYTVEKFKDFLNGYDS